DVHVKVVVTAGTELNEVARAAALVRKIGSSIPFIVQPVSPARDVTKTVSESRLFRCSAMAHREGLQDVRIIPQTHKILGVR
ncbi:MAG: 7-carboxy-7-deazaguanine synthase QueE, partial [Candidatus Omnitrophota bacterium]